MARPITHGYRRLSNTEPLYRRWTSMNDRCREGKSKYPRYNGRGITVYPEWRTDYPAFRSYCYDKFPDLDKLLAEGCQLDREDNDGHYVPGNIRFVTSKINTGNRRTAKTYYIFGETWTYRQLHEAFVPTEVSYRLFMTRIKRGWDLSSAVQGLRR